MRSFWIALSMYSKFPAPQVEWDKKSLSWALCFLPAVGAGIGAVLALWLMLSQAIDLGTHLTAAGALILPVALSGGIHLDGFCDTADALGSHQDRERKLEILKDTHTGAFAIICCCLYLILFFAAWCEVELSWGAIGVLALGPVLSRCLSALAAVSWPNARGSGLLASFTGPMDAKRARSRLLGLALLLCCFLPIPDLWTGVAAVGGALAAFLYYRTMAKRQFGGITGDLAGFFLQICECAMVIAVVLAQHIEELL